MNRSLNTNSFHRTDSKSLHNITANCDSSNKIDVSYVIIYIS
jgi:hypothetical protein